MWLAVLSVLPACTVRLPLQPPTVSTAASGCEGPACADETLRPEPLGPPVALPPPSEVAPVPPPLPENQPGTVWVPRPRTEGLDALPAPDRDYVTDALPSSAGAVIDAREVTALERRLAARLRELGYLEAEVEVRLVREPPPQYPELAIRIEPGPRYRLGEIVIEGAHDHAARDARDATGLAPGGRLEPRLLELARENILNLGVFEAVTVELGPRDPVARTVAVLIRVRPHARDQLVLQPVVAADSGRHVARLRAEYGHRLVDQGLQLLTVGGSLGWAFAPSVQSHLLQRAPAERRGFVGGLGVTLTLPRVARSAASMSLGLDLARDLLPAYTYNRFGARWLLPIRFTTPARVVLTPSLELEQYLELPTDAIVQLPGATTQARSACGQAPGLTGPRDCRLFWAGLAAAFDGRDDRLRPRRGLLASGSLRLAGSPLSEFGFVRLDSELRGYLPLSAAFTLLVRGRIGLVEQFAGPPLPEVALLYSGGGSSVRTTGTQQLGPRDYVVLPDPTQAGGLHAGPPIPRGGHRVWETSAELRWRTPVEPLSLLAFFDAGEVQVADSAASHRQFGPGLGLRYVTGVGIVGASVAYRLGGRRALPVGLDLSRAPAADPDPGNYSFEADCPVDDYHCRQEATFGVFHFALSLGMTP